VQTLALKAVPEAKRGIYYALADLLLRPSEARVLRIRDWTRNEIRVERAAKDRLVQGLIRGPKKRKGGKTLPVSERLGAWLVANIAAERRLERLDDPLFWNPDSRTGWWSETALRRTWGWACKRSGVTRVGVYEGTKHSTATHLKSLGADDRLLAAIMGHGDPRSVEKYAKVQGTAIRSALAKLDQQND
jgi:integrase